MTIPMEHGSQSKLIEDTAQDWFLRLTSGDVSEQDRLEFAKWRDADARHRDAYDEISELWNDLDRFRTAFETKDANVYSDPIPLSGTTGRTRPLVHDKPARRRRRQVIAGLAAACIAAVVIGSADLPTRFAADHRTNVGEQANILLPDGTRAYLNTDTAISLGYSSEKRQILLLRGEAVFDVATDPDRPFTVRALGGDTTATGTVFGVWDRGTSATVSVDEGSVAVLSPASGPVRPVNLTAGQRVSYVEGAPPGPVSSFSPEGSATWRDGVLLIEGLPLDQAIAEIDRYLPGQVLLLADTSDLEPVTARLSLKSVNSGLRALAATHGLSVTEIPGYLTIVR
ncbi:MAG: FecR domain-containing protein [Pseudomonadota bacterium]